VVRLWDLRRMILPLTYFINTPFQNWTYSTANLIGSVDIQVDYSVPVAAIRDEVARILASAPLWDKHVGNVAMTDATKDASEIRVLVSARNSSDLFDLRCLVRERLVRFISERYPGSLPGTRTENAPVPAGAGSR
jgi:small-conductance mechanosensitive channel